MSSSNREKRGFFSKGWFSSGRVRRYRHSAHYEAVLGTSLEFQSSATTSISGSVAEKTMLAEIDRLQGIFNAYQPDSELRRWQDTFDEDVAVSPELNEVLRAAADWTARTQLAFNPAVEALTRLWEEHAERNEPVAEGALAEVVEQLRRPLWETNEERGTARRLTRLPVTLNSIAKGYIIDAAATHAAQCPEVCEVLVNIGGDLRHLGSKATTVDITDPFASAENAPQLDTVQICNQGLATSGNYRRGFQIGEQWFSHVLDPRTGRPVGHTVGVSVIAENAMTADVLATAFSVLTPRESLEMAEVIPNIGVLIVVSDGSKHRNKNWLSQRPTSQQVKG